MQCWHEDEKPRMPVAVRVLLVTLGAAMLLVFGFYLFVGVLR